MLSLRHIFPAFAIIFSPAPDLCALERVELSRELAAPSGPPEHTPLWDFTKQACISENTGCYLRQTGNELYEQLSDCCRAYWINGDTVYFRGYNRGRREYMLADTLVEYLHYPLLPNTELYTSYTCHGALDMNVATTGSAIYKSEVLSCGKAIVDADTLRPVYLVRETAISKQHVDIAGDTDIIAPQHTVIYRWIAGAGTMPFAVMIQSDGNPPRLFAASGTDLQDMADSDVQEDSQPDIERILRTAQVSRGEDGSVRLAFSGAEQADVPVDVYLLDVQGNTYSHAAGVLSRAGEIRLAVPPQLRGRYMVAVCVSSDHALNYKLMIDL